MPTTSTTPFHGFSRQFLCLQIPYAIFFNFLGKMFAVTLNLTMHGNEMQGHRQTSTEPESVLQHTPSYRIATDQCSKHKMLTEINYPLRAFFVCVE